MVHIPFLNIEFPEPRVLEIIPDVVVNFIKVCSRLMDAAERLVYPLSLEEQMAIAYRTSETIPREFDRVIKRQLEGKIKNNEQMSSELEDASYDYYRRLLRTNIVGATDEGHDEFMSRQLWGVARHPGAEIMSQHLMEHPDAGFNTEEHLEALVAEGSYKAEEPSAQLAALLPQRAAQLKQQFKELKQRAAARGQALTEQQVELQNLRSKARTSMAQATRTTFNAGVGVALALLAFKGAALGIKHLFKAIRKGKRKAPPPPGRAAPATRQGRTSTSGAPTAQASPAAPGRPPRAQATQPQQQAPSTPATAQARSTSAQASPATAATAKATTQQQQQQPQSNESSPASARRSRPATRTR